MPRHSRFLLTAVLLCLAVAGVLAGSSTMLGTLSVRAAGPGTTERVSVDSAENQSAGGSSDVPSISADGRFVAFYSYATNLVPGDTNAATDIFVRDRDSGITTRVSVDSSGNQGNGSATYNGIYPTISGDGRFVVFNSDATNLVPGDTNDRADVFVHDRQTGVTERVSVDSGGNQANGSSYGIREVISADGRFVAFESVATNLVLNDTNGPGWDAFVHDRQTGRTERVSGGSGDNQANGSSFSERMSADGRLIAFASNATNLVPGDTNGLRDVFVYDRLTGGTERVSVDSNGSEGNGATGEEAWISGDGRFVSFTSDATNLVPGDTNGVTDVFVHDRQTGATERVSVASDGTQANDSPLVFSSTSADGRYVTFGSSATNLVTGDTNGRTDVFVRDRQAHVTTRVDLDDAANQPNDNSANPVMSSDGRFVAFASVATNLVAGDTNGLDDVFVRDRCPDGSCVGTPPAPPVWDVSSGSLTVHAGDEAVVYLAADDPNALDIVTIERTGELPVGMSCTYYTGSPATGECHWVPTDGQLGTYLVSFVAHDTGGLQSDVHVVTINVVPQLPTYLAISDSYGTGCSIASNPAGDAICERAVTSYPMFLRAYWEQDAYPNLQLIALTRWGETAAYFAAGDGRSSIETALLRKPKVITITLGANDFRLPDLEYWLVSSASPSQQAQLVQLHADEFKANLGSILSLIHFRSPDSTVLVTSYPNPATKGRCDYIRGYWDFLAYNVKGKDGLKDAILKVTSEFSQARFVELDNAQFDKHTMASKSPWYFGTNCGEGFLEITLPGLVRCFFNKPSCDPHPNQQGAKAIADTIRASAVGRLH
jgi:lysophospholipase L1-like esterase